MEKQMSFADLSKKDSSNPEKFQRFHEKNPHVYLALRELAWNLKVRGIRKCGMKMLLEKLRWEYFIETSGGKYKLNNTYGPYYARMLMKHNSELKGFFMVKKSQADNEEKRN